MRADLCDQEGCLHRVPSAAVRGNAHQVQDRLPGREVHVLHDRIGSADADAQRDVLPHRSHDGAAHGYAAGMRADDATTTRHPLRDRADNGATSDYTDGTCADDRTAAGDPARMRANHGATSRDPTGMRTD